MRVIFPRLNPKGQIAVEYVIIIGFAFAMTLPLLLLFNHQASDINEQVTSSQVNKVADEIVTAADSVYYLGEPSTKTLTLYFPQGISNITLDNHTIQFNVESINGDYQVVRWAASSLNGSLRPFAGMHTILIIAYENNVSIQD